MIHIFWLALIGQSYLLNQVRASEEALQGEMTFDVEAKHLMTGQGGV